MRRNGFALIVAALVTVQSARADVPAKMTYQGVLKNASGTIVADGTYQLTFKLHNDPTAGTVVWTGAPQDVVVSRGLFTAILTGGTPDFSTVGFDQPLHLSIAVGTGSDLTPRIELTPAPYTMVARAVTAGGVSGTAIADGTITNADISSSAAIAGSKVAPSFSGTVFAGGLSVGKSCLGCAVTDMIVASLQGIFSTNITFRVESHGNVFADGTFTGGGADYSDMMPVSGGPNSIAPGDVVAIDPMNPRSVIKATQPRSSLVAGIYSSKPGFLGLEQGPEEPVEQTNVASSRVEPHVTSTMVPVALTGIVPCNVSAENGPLRPGDLLVTSATPGHAMRDDSPRPGTILGKALEPLKAGTGVIMVLVALH